MTAEGVPAPPDRRARRRQETIEEILVIAAEVMTEAGVNGLSLSEVARRLGVKPPSIYKYFDSLMGIYDALFERGQRTNLETMRAAMEGAEPGLDALALRAPLPDPGQVGDHRVEHMGTGLDVQLDAVLGQPPPLVLRCHLLPLSFP